MKKTFFCFFCCWQALVFAGEQQYEPLSASVQAALHDAVSDSRPMISSFKSPLEAANWLADMSARLARRIPERDYRLDLLRSVHYEATRAGLDPQMVLGLIEVESAFRKYAVSSAGARGYMQVMPFWLKVLSRPNDNLFDMRTNLRYGCTILRHYIDIEKGDLFRALGRYNGSLGRAEYPNLVKNAWNKWLYTSETLIAEPETAPAPITTEPSPLPTAPIAQTTPQVAENVYVYPTTIINQIEEQRVIVVPNHHHRHRPPPPPPQLPPPPQTLKERNAQRVQEIQQKARNTSGLNPSNNPRFLNQNQQTPNRAAPPPPQHRRTLPPPPPQHRGYYAPF